MRTLGILIPAFSPRRPGDLGIGDTRAMRDWIDWASRHQIGFIQLLPINENGTDESPYSGISSIALDPIYLSFDPPEIPCLAQPDIDAARSTLAQAIHDPLVEYTAVRQIKHHLLEISYSRFPTCPDPALHAEFKLFQKENQTWLPDYCLFKLLIETNDPGTTWDQWPEPCRTPKAARSHIQELRLKHPSHIDARLGYFAYVQWLCFRQWRALRAHADYQNVKLMGDVPIGISYHSADVFFHRDQFHIDWFGGTPPEPYSADNPFIHEWGQNWGIPLYRWDLMEQNNYAWWRNRIANLTEIFRIFRIDHILGFYRIYGFPWHPRDNQKYLGLNHHDAYQLAQNRFPSWFHHPDDTPENKAANLANGDHRLRPILKAAGDAEIIAEDLGWVPEYVRPHLAELGIAGYRIPHWDFYADGTPIPGSAYPELSFASFSTHDHDSLYSTWENCRNTIDRQHTTPTEPGHWAAEGCAHALRLLATFSGIPIPENNHWPAYSDAIHWRLIKALLASNSRYATLMITDLFALPDRINHPGTNNPTNWRFRINLPPEQIEATGQILSNLIAITSRKRSKNTLP